MRTLGYRRTAPGAVVAGAAAALSFAALFFGRGTSLPSLVWIGGFTILLVAAIGAAGLAGLLPTPRLDGPGAVFFLALVGLAAWVGLTTLWSASPDASWQYTNRTVVYAAFALLGALAAALLDRPAERLAQGAAALLALLLGWALLAKCIPSLYSDYGRVARLRYPLDYWNELALLAAVAVPVALWLASRRRVLGAVLLYGAGTTVLLTYSRFGVALACVAAVASIVLAADRVGSLAAVAVAAIASGATFGIALALPGITKDGRSHSVRAHDGWIFLLVLLAGVAVVAAAAALAPRVLLAGETARRRIERSAALAGVAAVAAVVVGGIVEAHRIWRSFANPVSSQIASSQGRLGSLNSSNRWRWWQEAWNAFVHHPGGGTGAGTFQFTDLMHRSTSIVTTTEPHNVPLQFLSETGVVGFLLFLAVVIAAIVALLRVRGGAAVALAIAVCAFFAHLVVDTDWDYVATCGPLFFVAGALVVRGSSPPSRRPLTAAATVLVALAAVYSLAAPYAAVRELGTGTTLSQVKSAHSLDPLSTDALEDWGALETVVSPARAQQLYRQAVSLEPENAYTWLALGDFYWETHRYVDAYLAYSDAWAVDKFGPAGVPCGPLDQARHRVLDVWPPSCPGGRPASTH